PVLRCAGSSTLILGTGRPPRTGSFPTTFAAPRPERNAMRRILLTFACASGLWCGTAPAQDAPPRYETRADHDPSGIGKFYLGREIAHVMGHQAAGWLERPEREQEEQPKKLLEALALKPGMAVADIGAGSGYYTFRMADAVGEAGTIYAVDIQ